MMHFCDMNREEFFKELKGWGIEAADIARKVSLSYQAVKDIVDNVTQRPRASTWREIVDAVGYDVRYDDDDEPQFYPTKNKSQEGANTDVAGLKEEVDALRQENAKLREENKELRIQVRDLLAQLPSPDDLERMHRVIAEK